ncbi:MFS transporter [Glaciimonas immobilis]|uniref:MFS family permease n=1 Tax=Glaciimonas immobilis TaxID=728004 RepID=A0A840RLB4_9BURK|nr:MFS transporter [Glaciimonas immobilis]KAF3999522.1 MFS transporter [Glaciimonas immobilis]MBB5199057.1 MFS family permease [Glaciimonas immobilis]
MLKISIGKTVTSFNARPQPALAGKRWYVLAMLSLCLILSMTTWFSATAVIPQLRVAWGLTDSLAAWLTIGVQIGFVIGAVGSSVMNLSDVVQARQLMIVGSIGAAIANLCMLFAGDAWLAITFRTLTGVFLALVYPPALKLIATWFTTGRGFALGALVGAVTLGSASPHLVNAVGGLQWQIVITTTSVATLTGALLVALFVHDGPYPFPRAPFSPGRVKQVFHNRAIVLASLGYFGHMWELYAMWAWFLTFARMALAAQHSGGATAASFLTFAVIAVGAIGCIVGGVFGDRWGRTLTTSLMMALSGVCAVLAGVVFAGPPWLFITISLVWGFTVVADSAQFSTIVTELGDPMYVGTALTLQLGLGFILTVVTIWLLPLAATLLNSWQWVFLILLPGPLLGIIAMLLLRRLPEAKKIADGNR